MLKIPSKAVLIAVVGSLIAATATSAMAETKWEKRHPRRDQVNDRLHKQNRRKRPARTPCYLEMRKGSSSSMRLLGQAGSFSRVSFSQA